MVRRLLAVIVLLIIVSPSVLAQTVGNTAPAVGNTVPTVGNPPPVVGNPAPGYNSTLSPARKIFQMKRGEEASYVINYQNNAASGVQTGDDKFDVTIGDFYYDANGNQTFLSPDNVLDKQQSLFSWVTIPKGVTAKTGNQVSVPVKIKVPEGADFGDHMGAIFIGQADAPGGGSVVIKGRLASILIIKVLGGEPSPQKIDVQNFDIITRQKARNTVTFSFDLANKGREFFTVSAEADIYEYENDAVPIKKVNYSAEAFPNAKKTVKIPLGDMGADIGEQQYYAHFTVFDDSKTPKVIFADYKKPFYYYLPARDDAPVAPAVIQKDTPSATVAALVQVLKDFGLYIAVFILVLVVLIRVLFFSRKEEREQGKK